jgi:hypothetical protein
MPNETAISNSSNGAAWQQTSSNNNTIDTPPDSAGLPVRYTFVIIFRTYFNSL